MNKFQIKIKHMKRFILFCWEDCEAGGGLFDFNQDHDKLNKLKKIGEDILQNTGNNIQILDTETGKTYMNFPISVPTRDVKQKYVIKEPSKTWIEGLLGEKK